MKKLAVGKIILAIIVIGAIVGGIFFYRNWYMPHRDVKDEKGVEVTAQSIMDAYTADEKKANGLYLDKAIQVTGEVTEISKNKAGKTVISLKTNDPMGGVRCTMKVPADNIKVGAPVIVKGICTGYLMDVTLIDCYLVQ